MTCPKCGAQLQPVALDPNTAPWLCRGCRRGFFACELTKEARAIYRPQHDDWGLGLTPLHTPRSQEIAAAHQRGTSLREDQFVHTPISVLTSLAKRAALGPEFQTLLETHLTGVN